LFCYAYCNLYRVLEEGCFISAIIKIAENEFSLVARNPLVLVFVGFMALFAIINMLGVSSIPSGGNYDFYTQDERFYATVECFFYLMSMLFAFFSTCVGVVAVSDERWRGSLRVLFTKPLYRRDVIIGKFLGISAFVYVLIVVTLTVFVSLMITVEGGPSSLVWLVVKLWSFTVLLFLNASFTIGLVMVLGILLSEKAALIASVMFLSFEWLQQMGGFTGTLNDFKILDPVWLYLTAYSPVTSPSSIGNWSDVFSMQYIVWLQAAYPYVVLMIAEVVIIVLVNCMLFSREEA
jgi:ABC-2 type transport system permease protein